MVAQAIPYWQRAGQRAIERSANLEAIGYLTKGLEMLESCLTLLPGPGKRLDVQTALGLALKVTHGWCSQRYKPTPGRGHCVNRWKTPQLFPVLFGLWTSSIVQPEFQAARGWGSNCCAWARRPQTPRSSRKPLGPGVYLALHGRVCAGARTWST